MVLILLKLFVKIYEYFLANVWSVNDSCCCTLDAYRTVSSSQFDFVDYDFFVGILKYHYCCNAAMINNLKLCYKIKNLALITFLNDTLGLTMSNDRKLNTTKT